MSLPWYVTVTLFLLSPAYAILVRDKVWPRIADWWSTRSKSRLRLRISKLERRLSDAEVLPLHSDAEDNLFQGVHSILILVGMGTHLIIATLFGIASAFSGIVKEAYGDSVMTRVDLAFLATIMFNFLFLLALAHAHRRYWEPRSKDWRDDIQQELVKLRSKL